MLVTTILTLVNTTLALFSYLWSRYTGRTGFRLKSTWKTSVGQSPPRPTGVLSCQCYWHEGTADLQQQVRVTRNMNLESRTKNHDVTGRLQPRLAVDLDRQLLKHLDPNLHKDTASQTLHEIHRVHSTWHTLVLQSPYPCAGLYHGSSLARLWLHPDPRLLSYCRHSRCPRTSKASDISWPPRSFEGHSTSHTPTQVNQAYFLSGQIKYHQLNSRWSSVSQFPLGFPHLKDGN